MTLTSIKLDIKSWLLISGAFIISVLLIIIGYKSKKLHAAQVALLRANYSNVIDSLNAKTKALSASARAASSAYSAARSRYTETHGGL